MALAEPLPVGTYLLRLAEAEHRDSSAGRWIVRLRFEAVDPPYAGQSVFASIAPDTLAEGAIIWRDAVCEALGVKVREFVRRPDLFVGREVLAYLTIYKLRDGQRVNVVRRMSRPIPVPDANARVEKLALPEDVRWDCTDGHSIGCVHVLQPDLPIASTAGNDELREAETIARVIAARGGAIAPDRMTRLMAEYDELRARNEKAESARVKLIRVLELDEDMSWDDVVAYAAKAKGTIQMTLATVERRTKMLLEALGRSDVSDAMAWSRGLEMVRRLRAGSVDDGANVARTRNDEQ